MVSQAVGCLALLIYVRYEILPLRLAPSFNASGLVMAIIALCMGLAFCVCT